MNSQSSLLVAIANTKIQVNNAQNKLYTHKNYFVNFIDNNRFLSMSALAGFFIVGWFGGGRSSARHKVVSVAKTSMNALMLEIKRRYLF